MVKKSDLIRGPEVGETRDDYLERISDPLTFEAQWQINKSGGRADSAMAAGYATRMDRLRLAMRIIADAEAQHLPSSVVEKIETCCWSLRKYPAGSFQSANLRNKLLTLFGTYKKVDVDAYSANQKNNCRKLATARAAAGYIVHPAWRKYAVDSDPADGRE